MIEFEPSQTYRLKLSGSPYEYKIHIMYVLDSVYKDEKLIVYRYYGRHKQYWHQDMKSSTELEMYIDRAKKG